MDYTLTSFVEPITDLPTTPNLSPEELKRRFQAPADELRLAHNLLCAEVERISTVVNGLVAQTFTKAVSENMLDDALFAKLNAKADQSALSASNARIDEAFTVLDEKNGVACGTYIGDGTYDRIITLGFRPKAVMTVCEGEKIYVNGINYGGLSCDGTPLMYGEHYMLSPCDDGFVVSYDTDRGRCALNISGTVYHYFAVR